MQKSQKKTPSFEGIARQENADKAKEAVIQFDYQFLRTMPRIVLYQDRVF